MNANFRRAIFSVILGTGSTGVLVQEARAWAIGSETEVTNTGVAHQWASNEGWKLFKYQFGPSEIDNYLGGVTEFPAGGATDGDNKWIEGVYDEDVKGQNPFNYNATLDHPSFRHFWSPRDTIGPISTDYSRDFDDGLDLFPSAANNALKFFTGGRGLTGILDGDWGKGKGFNGKPVADKGIEDYYKGSGVGQSKEFAYYWFGHVIHLLQDMAMPAHALSDSHQEIGAPGGIGDDPDPLHDWVDGKPFSTSVLTLAPTADFNDVNPTRYERWGFQPNGAVGRAGVPESMQSAPLQSPQQIKSRYDANGYLPETMNSVPNGALGYVLPLYLLFTETAREGALYDSKDYSGQSDRGGRNSDHRFIPTPGFYDNWTRTELEEVADQVYPKAMYATATAIRYFYSRVDATAPTVTWNGLPTDANAPLFLTLASGQTERSVMAEILASDDISGVDLDGYTFQIQKHNGAAWVDFGGPFTGSSTTLTGLYGAGQYRAFVRIENGAGLFGSSSFGYFTIAPVPEPAAFSLLAIAAPGTAWRRKRA